MYELFPHRGCGRKGLPCTLIIYAWLLCSCWLFVACPNYNALESLGCVHVFTFSCVAWTAWWRAWVSASTTWASRTEAARPLACTISSPTRQGARACRSTLRLTVSFFVFARLTIALKPFNRCKNDHTLISSCFSVKTWLRFSWSSSVGCVFFSWLRVRTPCIVLVVQCVFSTRRAMRKIYYLWLLSQSWGRWRRRVCPCVHDDDDGVSCVYSLHLHEEGDAEEDSPGSRWRWWSR